MRDIDNSINYVIIQYNMSENSDSGFKGDRGGYQPKDTRQAGEYGNILPDPLGDYREGAGRRTILDRIRKSKTAKAVTAGAALTAAGYGLLGHSDGPKGPEYNHKTESSMGQVIQPATTKIAEAALALMKNHPDQVLRQPAGKGLVEVSGISNNGLGNDVGRIDAIMSLRNGSPNPQDVKYAEISSDMQVDNKNGVSWDIAFSSPEGQAFAKRANVTNAARSGGNLEGWTAYSAKIVSKDGVADDLLSGIIDSTDTNSYAVDDNQNSVGPVGTARDAAQNVDDILPGTVDAFGIKS